MPTRVSSGLGLHLEARGQGAPLILLHGFTGSVEAWGGRLLEELSSRYRVLAVDLPGHGRSDLPADPAAYGVWELVQDLAGLLDTQAVPRAHWVGYSMGGRAALAAAVLAPERVERLVLESASPGLESEQARLERRASDEALAQRLCTGGLESFVSAWMAQPMFESQRRLPGEVREAQRSRRLRQRPEGLAAALRGLGAGAQPSFWGRLSEVRAPTLLLTGEEDRGFTATASRMAALLPAAQLLAVPDAGHTVHLEAPVEWLEAVVGFLG